MTTSTVVKTAEGLELSAEAFGTEGPPIVLVMGLGAQMLLWPDPFCQALADLGHRVIRFDNRDVGGSTRFTTPPPNVPMAYLKARLGRPLEPDYTLADMAGDTIAVLDHFGIERATLVGASMGGMIVQHAAARFPGRVSSLVSIMSSSRPPRPRPRAVRALLRRPQPGRQGAIEHTVRMFGTIGSQTQPLPEADLRELAGRCFDRGPSPGGFARQFVSILADGDRAEMLRNIQVPSLVVHGDEDSLIPLYYGILCAKLLRARLEVIQGMGHDFPPACWPHLTERISVHAKAHNP